MVRCLDLECSRTRLEFKDSRLRMYLQMLLKCSRTRLEFKVDCLADISVPSIECSRTRLEFKGALIQLIVV